jgi:hypothetical protein
LKTILLNPEFCDESIAPGIDSRTARKLELWFYISCRMVF